LVIPRRRKRVDVHLPRVISFRDNYAETVSAINSIKEVLLTRNAPIMLYFDQVKEIEPAATLVLAAEIERCNRFRKYRGSLLVNGTYPPDVDVRLLLAEMGFYKRIGVPELDDDDQDAKHGTADRPRFVKFISFDSVESEVAALITDVVSVGAFAMSDQLQRRMTGALKEAMGNAVEHAYRERSKLPRMDGRWWCAAYVEPRQGEMMIILFDQGVGIPGTLDPGVFEIITALITTRKWEPSDGNMIAAATELYRTSTGQSGRGRGFRDMKKFINECDDGELRVLSNRGSYRYMKTGETVHDEDSSIGGTVVEWRVRHGQPVDFEDA
jgi:hypothetical protein